MRRRPSLATIGQLAAKADVHRAPDKRHSSRPLCCQRKERAHGALHWDLYSHPRYLPPGEVSMGGEGTICTFVVSTQGLPSAEARMVLLWGDFN
jgi:hypothetical protein